MKLDDTRFDRLEREVKRMKMEAAERKSVEQFEEITGTQWRGHRY